MKHDFVTKLRDINTSTAEFRRASDQLARMLAYEVTNKLELNEKTVETPLQKTKGHEYTGKIILLPILRSGLALLPTFLSVFEEAAVGFTGLKRDETTARPDVYYLNVPSIDSNTDIIILDPMIATGGTACKAISQLIDQGADEKRIRIAAIIGAPEGVDVIHQQYPHIDITVAVMDEGLNTNYFITPGLGDFGDRYFQT